jgi:hypothetical protein
VGTWTHPDTIQFFDEQTIFDYMNGAAEIYVGYRFSRLEVYEYTSTEEAEDDLLVELYWMDSPDDAFGLLSRDWSGDLVTLSDETNANEGENGLPHRRAFYGGGLLRLWSNDLYARVMAYRETEASKEAVLEVGRAMVAGRSNPHPPTLVSGLPHVVGSEYNLQREQICYLRSHFILNSIYPLGMQNLLDLHPSVEAVVAAYGKTSEAEGGMPTWLLLVDYANPAAAENALNHFRRDYLAEHGKGPGLDASSDRGLAELKGGWTGFARSGAHLAVVLDAQDVQSGHRFIDSGLETLGKIDEAHDQQGGD